MSNRDIARLTFVSLGIYTLIQAVPVVSNAAWSLGMFISSEITAREHAARFAFYRPFSNLNSFWSGFLRVLPLLLYGLAGTGLIVGSRRLAKRVFPEEEPANHRQRVVTLQAFVYSVIGLVLLTFGLRNLALVGVTFWISLSSIGVRWDYFWDHSQYDVIGSLLYLLLGTSLFFGSHGLFRLWSRLRYSGLRRQMGLCIHCGYDLTGNTSGRCPECGTPLAAPAPPAPQVLLRNQQMSGRSVKGGETAKNHEDAKTRSG